MELLKAASEQRQTGPALQLGWPYLGGGPWTGRSLLWRLADFFEVVRRIALARSAIPEGSRASSTGIRARSSCASA